MNKIYCFNNGGPEKFLTAMAMAEDGTILATHICSDEYYMEHDLGITSNLKHKNYNSHYGEGNWKLEWVEDPPTHKGLQAAYKKNQELKPEPKCNNPSVTIELDDGRKIRREF